MQMGGWLLIGCRLQETYLREKVGEAEREQMMLSHALADKDAQLQLQETRTKVRTLTNCNDRAETVLAVQKFNWTKA